jgi:hypothetical protein
MDFSRETAGLGVRCAASEKSDRRPAGRIVAVVMTASGAGRREGRPHLRSTAGLRSVLCKNGEPCAKLAECRFQRDVEGA